METSMICYNQNFPEIDLLTELGNKSTDKRQQNKRNIKLHNDDLTGSVISVHKSYQFQVLSSKLMDYAMSE